MYACDSRMCGWMKSMTRSNIHSCDDCSDEQTFILLRVSVQNGGSAEFKRRAGWKKLPQTPIDTTP